MAHLHHRKMNKFQKRDYHTIVITITIQQLKLKSLSNSKINPQRINGKNNFVNLIHKEIEKEV